MQRVSSLIAHLRPSTTSTTGLIENSHQSITQCMSTFTNAVLDPLSSVSVSLSLTVSLSHTPMSCAFWTR
jgi:hypothetical protein